jgi:PAT family beta-lactamase induction signal transducer AmpG
MKRKNSKLEFLKSQKLFLTENAVLRYVLFSVLYFAQGIPGGITIYAIPAWLAMNDKTPMEIATYSGVVLIPWSFKIILGPLMDRYTILSMGRKRPWVIFGQLGLILSFLAMGFVPDPLNNLNGLMIIGFIISVFACFQDVGTDGMAIDVIPENEQARANGLMWGSATIGYALSMVIGTTLISVLGFSEAIPLMSISTVFIIIAPILFRERPGEKLMPWTTGEPSPESKNIQSKSWVEIFKALFKVTILPSSIILCVIFFFKSTVEGVIDTLLPVFTIQNLGWTDISYSHAYSITSVIGGVFGMIFGGIIVDMFGAKKMLTIYLGVYVLLFGVMGLSSNFWGNDTVVFGFMLLYLLFSTFISISIFASAMKLCWKTVAATQFTLYMAISNMGIALGRGALGVLNDFLTWENIFLLMAVISLITITFIKYLNFTKHSKSLKAFNKNL